MEGFGIEYTDENQPNTHEQMDGIRRSATIASVEDGQEVGWKTHSSRRQRWSIDLRKVGDPISKSVSEQCMDFRDRENLSGATRTTKKRNSRGKRQIQSEDEALFFLGTCGG